MNFITDSKNRNIVAASVAVVAVLTTGLLLWGSSSGSDDMLPALTEEETVKVMSIILERTKVAAVRLARGAEGIKQQIAEQGVQMDLNVVLRQFVLPHVETAIREIQEKVYGEFDVEECDLEEAFQFYLDNGNAELKGISVKMKQIYNEFGGQAEIESGSGDKKGKASAKKAAKAPAAAASAKVEESEEAPSGPLTTPLDENNLIMVLEKLSKDARVQTGVFIEGFMATLGPPTTPEMSQQFQMGMMAVSQQVQTATLESYGLSMEDFEAGVTKFANSERLRAAVTRMQMETQEALAAYGLQMQ